MHELSLCESVLRLIEEHAERHGFTRVKTVKLEIGALSHVEPDAMRFGFDVVTKGSIAEGARLEIDRPPGEAWCWDCQAMVGLDDRAAACPHCRGHRLELRQGEELRVKELEVEGGPAGEGEQS